MAAPPTAIRTTADAIHVPELIRNGSSADGLKAARATAAASLPGYPTNGCAAHLSALLRHSGIDVAMTWGAGKLAHVLADRGSSEITVGGQRPGDVGVCYDNDPTPPGADHVYLVVGPSGPDEMLVADNQRKTDAPHTRYASGHGKTPTEYFLRAIKSRAQTFALSEAGLVRPATPFIAAYNLKDPVNVRLTKIAGGDLASARAERQDHLNPYLALAASQLHARTNQAIVAIRIIGIIEGVATTQRVDDYEVYSLGE